MSNPPPQNDLFFTNTHTQENALPLKALRTKGANCLGLTNIKTSVAQWYNAKPIWNKNSPMKLNIQHTVHTVPKIAAYLRWLTFSKPSFRIHVQFLWCIPISLSCSFSDHFPWKVSLSLRTDVHQDTHEIDPCVLNPSAYTSSTCDLLQRLLRDDFGVGIFDGKTNCPKPPILFKMNLFTWIDGLSMVYLANPALRQHKSALHFALPIFEFRYKISFSRFAHGPHVRINKLLLIQIIWRDIQKMLCTSFCKFV